MNKGLMDGTLPHAIPIFNSRPDQVILPMPQTNYTIISMRRDHPCHWMELEGGQCKERQDLVRTWNGGLLLGCSASDAIELRYKPSKRIIDMAIALYQLSFDATNHAGERTGRPTTSHK